MKKLSFILMVFILSNNLVFAQSKGKQDTEAKTVKIKTTAQCEECKERIEKAMAYEKGVKSSDLDLDTKVLTVVYNGNKTTDLKLRTAVAKTGYDADDVKKDPKAYKALPACCKLPTDPEYRPH
jgi:copper chaperone CopZ